MSKSLRFFLIDPVAETVEERNEVLDLQAIYRLLECRRFEIVYSPTSENVLFVDEEGLLPGSPEDRAFFSCHGFRQPFLSGRGLYLGPADDEGESTSVQGVFEAEEMRQRVCFTAWNTIAQFGVHAVGNAARELILEQMGVIEG